MREPAALPPPLRRPWRGQTYHERPVVKASSFDWKVSTYIVLQGIAGAAQIIAALAGRGPAARRLKRRARLLALAGALGGPLVLIQHLKTPQRWYNMLRIVRPTSPMSLGSWLLATFGALTTAVAAGDLLGRGRPAVRQATDAAQVPTAVAGAGMSVYTASLLASTSTPLWATARGSLGAQFGCASMAGAASALALVQRACGETRSARQLERLALLATLGEFVAGQLSERAWRKAGIAAPVESGRAAPLHQIGGKLVGVGLPLAATAVGTALGGRARRYLPLAASLAVLVGGAAMRHSVLIAGNESARRPRDTFRVTQPRPRLGGRR